MKRKLLILIFVVITCMACVFGITACNTDKPDDGGQGTVQTPPEEKPNDTEKPSENNKPNENDKPSVVEVTGITLSKTTLALEVNDVETLTATVTPNNATDKTVTWNSSDSTVAKVENGKVTALKEGIATIIAIAGNKSTGCTVMVVPTVEINVESVTLNKTTLSLEVNESQTLTATVLPSYATDKTVTWKSSDSTVAKVENGKVTALKAGTATITATAGGKSATCKVTVTENVIAVTSVSLNKTTLSLEVNESQTLTATVLPSYATDKTVTWKSSDSSVAKVENGKVTALKAGTVIITATAGGKKATCTVTVAEKVIAVTSVSLNKTTLALEVDGTETLTATVTPSNATDKTVTWKSSDSTVAKVENGKVTALKAGTATITATAGEKEATCNVTVKNKTVEITAIYLNKTTLSLYIGDSETLTTTVLPSNATETVSWVSAAPAVATVDNGKVTGVSEGEATIIASSTSGKSVACTVTVTENTYGCVFEEYGDGYAVTAYNGSATSVTVPSTYKGKKVIAIGTGKVNGSKPIADGFALCSNLVSVTIPDTVKVINHGSFYYCLSLKELFIADSVTTIGSMPLYGCSKLERLTIPYAPSALKALFDGSNVPESLKEVVIMGGDSIPESAFYNCSSLMSVTIPDSVTSIGAGAFEYCDGLTNVAIPNSVTSIGNYAFDGCTGLTEVIWNAANCTQVGDSIFYRCTAYANLTFGKNIKTVPAGVFNGWGGLRSVTIPDSVTSIGSSAFSGCGWLTNIYYTGDIAGWCKISGLSNLMYFGYNNSGKKLYINNQEISGALIIPSDATLISDYAFNGCSGLTSVTIPDSVSTIGSNAFNGCSGLTSVTIGNMVKSIGERAFMGCSELMSVTIPNSVTTIGSSAFYGCGKLTSATIGSSVTTIGGAAFYECSGLTSVTIGNSVTTIGAAAFYKCINLRGDLVISDSVTSIGDSAFYGCSRLTSVTIGSGLKSIAYCAFILCSGLTSVTIGTSVKSIGDYAFSGSSSLKSVTIPESVKSIGEKAFYSSGFTEINYGGTKAQWDNISKGSKWAYGKNQYTIYCTDGDMHLIKGEY